MFIPPLFLVEEELPLKQGLKLYILFQLSQGMVS